MTPSNSRPPAPNDGASFGEIVPARSKRFSRLRRLAVGAVATAAVSLTAACAGGSVPHTSDATAGSVADTSETTTLTVYTDQHAELITGLTEAYTEATGVKFNIQNDATVGQIEAEGDASKADIFLSEDPGPVAQLGEKGLLSPIEKSTLDQVRPGLSSGKGLWVAYAARTRVLFYNPDLISEDELPKTLADIADPKFKGKFAWAPSGAFVATTQYLISTQGVEKTTAFLKALKENGIDEQKNGNVRDTVEAGKHAMGLSNHYYWWVLAAQEGGADSLTSKIYHFPDEDPGNLILSSGAGILKNSANQDEANKFVAWLTSKDGGQKLLADAPVDLAEAQYPVAPGLQSGLAGDLSEIKSPAFDMDLLASSEQAEDLLKTLGMSRG
jgi:iron(III) transport system substrate-binding protein